MFGKSKNSLFEIGDVNDRKLQLRIYDDRTFDFKLLETESALLIEKKDGNPIAAFEDPYANEYYFPGFRDIKEGMIIPGFNRDTLLELHPVVDDEKKPNQGQTYINEIAKNRARNLRHVPKETWQTNRITVAMFWISIILAVWIGLQVIT